MRYGPSLDTSIIGARRVWWSTSARASSLVDGIAEGAGRAVPDRPDDLVHPAAAGGDERLLAAVEDGGEPVGAQAGVLAGAAVVEDGHLLADVGVPPVRDPVGVLGVGEPDPGVRAVAEGLLADAPHRHKANCGRDGTPRPASWSSGRTFVTKYGPFSDA